LQRGAVFYDFYSDQSYLLDVFSAAVRDGRNNVLHRRLFVVQTESNGQLSIRQPTIFLDLVPSPKGTTPPDDPMLSSPNRDLLMKKLWEDALQKFQAEVSVARQKEITTIEQHISISLNTIIDRENQKFAQLIEEKESGSREAGLDGRLKQIEDHLMALNARLELRQTELKQEKQCTIDDMRHYGQVWVLPHPERNDPDLLSMVSDVSIEKRVVAEAIRYERSLGRMAESVESENRGFDLISRSRDPLNPQVRFIEVKGRASIGGIALTDNEYKTAERLKDDYWLYVVYNCATAPELHRVKDPTRMDWVSRIRIEHFLVNTESILRFEQDGEEA
jgi:hypothetical protein